MRFKLGIGGKINLVVSISVAMISLSTLVFFNKQQKDNILAQNERTMYKMTESVIRAVHNIMLEGFADIAQSFADDLKTVPDILDFSILRTDGSEAFRDNKTIDDVNRRRGDEDFSPRDEEAVIPIYKADDPKLLLILKSKKTQTFYEDGPDGVRQLTYLAPINNGEKCGNCHGLKHAIRGVLKLTTSLASVEKDIAASQKLNIIMFAVALMLTIVSVGYMTRRLVVLPAQQLTDAMQSASDGDLTQKVKVQSTDEIGLMSESFNLMTKQLLHTYNELKVAQGKLLDENKIINLRVEQRTAELTQKTLDMNAMLDNMNIGVFTLIKGNRIHPEYSNYLEVILNNDDLMDKTLSECLLDRCEMGADTKDQIITGLISMINEDELVFDFNSHVLVDEVLFKASDNSKKIIQLDWNAIVSEEGITEKVMVIAQDVTEVKQLELQATEQRKELDIVSQIIKISIGKFNDFIHSSFKFLEENKTIIENTQNKDISVLAALFRNMHTIKGNSRTLELTFLTDIIHEVEQTYDKLRSDESMPWDASLLLDELELAREGLNMYVGINEDKLGRKGRASDLLTSRGSFISNQQIDEFKSMVSALESYEYDSKPSENQASEKKDANVMVLKNLKHKLSRIGQIELKRLVDGSVDAMASLSKELNKPTPEVSIVDLGISFNNAIAEPLKSSFMHIVRNSMDHGIESAEERTSANKNAAGKLEFEVIDKKDHVELRIRDDGRGLALHKLYQKALDNNILRDSDNPTPQAVANLLFNSGLSTSEKVTKISGRGVGMDAVRAFLASQEASIQIELRQAANTEQQTGQLSFTPFDFVIMIPEGSYILSLPELKG
jgi:HAMP domain-containing protein/HPt (histidine-containing phosphotransfer) domain-containing protein